MHQIPLAVCQLIIRLGTIAVSSIIVGTGTIPNDNFSYEIFLARFINGEI